MNEACFRTLAAARPRGVQGVGRFPWTPGFRLLTVLPLPAGSISSCDAFLNVFQSKGLRQEVICPCASSPEALTVAIRRYGRAPAWRGGQSPACAGQPCFLAHGGVESSGWSGFAGEKRCVPLGTDLVPR